MKPKTKPAKQDKYYITGLSETGETIPLKRKPRGKFVTVKMKKVKTSSEDKEYIEKLKSLGWQGHNGERWGR